MIHIGGLFSFPLLYILYTIILGSFNVTSAPVKPRIIEHPNSAFPQKDHRVTLRCRADGDPAPTVTWYKDGKILDKQVSTDIDIQPTKLTLLSLHPRREGVYYCNASNSAGWAQSQNASVRIAYLDKNFLDPQPKTASVGETVLMECRPPDGMPKPKVYWHKDKQPVILDKRVKLLEKGDLRIDKAQRNDSGLYYCEARNFAFTAESNVAILQVRQKPRFQVTPKNQEVQVNGVVVFPCQVSGDLNTGITWSRENDEKIPEVRATLLEDKSLRIDKVQLTDAGNYICQAGSPSNYVEAVAKLTVISQPGFVRTPEDQDIRVGNNAKFHCVAAGSPQPEVRWVHNGKHYLPLDRPAANNRIRVGSDGLLTILSVRKADEGRYECRASSYTGSIQSSAKLRVIDINDHPPPVIELGPLSQVLMIDGTVTLRCQAKGNPRPSIDWFKNDLRIDFESSDKRILKLPSGTLQINVLKESDAANYTCKATSGKRSTKWSARLKILTPASPHDMIIKAPADERFLPRPPSNLLVMHVSDTSVELKWQAGDEETQANIEGYRVEYAEYDSTDGWIHAIEKTVHQRLKISGLKPETGYRFLVRAVNPYGWGRPRLLNDAVYTKAKLRISSLNLKDLINKMNSLLVKGIQLKSISTTEIKVSWNVEGSGSSLRLISGFELKYKSVPLTRCVASNNLHLRAAHCSLNDNLKHQFTLELEARRAQRESRAEGSEKTKLVRAVVSRESPSSYAVIEELQPFVCYEVDVEPYADPTPFGRVRGRESKAKTVLTYDGTPSDAPSSVKALWVSNTTVAVSWKEPDYPGRNGILTGYSVHIIGNETKFSRTILVSPRSNSIKVEHLLPQLGYTIHMAAMTCRGEGIRSPAAILLPVGMSHRVIPLTNKPWFIGTMTACGLVWLLLCLFVLIACRNRLRRHDKTTYDKEKKESHSLRPMISSQEPQHGKKHEITSSATESSSCNSRMTQNNLGLVDSGVARPPDLTILDGMGAANPHWEKCTSCSYDSSGGCTVSGTGSLVQAPQPAVNPVAPYASTSLLQQMMMQNYAAGGSAGGSHHSDSDRTGVCSECGGTGQEEAYCAAEHGWGKRAPVMSLRDMIPPPPEYPPPPAPQSPAQQYSGMMEGSYRDDEIMPNQAYGWTNRYTALPPPPPSLRPSYPLPTPNTGTEASTLLLPHDVKEPRPDEGGNNTTVPGYMWLSSTDAHRQAPNARNYGDYTTSLNNNQCPSDRDSQLILSASPSNSELSSEPGDDVAPPQQLPRATTPDYSTDSSYTASPQHQTPLPASARRPYQPSKLPPTPSSQHAPRRRHSRKSVGQPVVGRHRFTGQLNNGDPPIV